MTPTQPNNKERKMSEEKIETTEVEPVEEEVKEPAQEPKVETKTNDVESYKEALEKEIREKIRKQEKDKLYESFEKYKEDARKAEEARKTAEEKLKEYELSKLTAEEQSVLKLTQLEEANNTLQTQMQSLVEEANNKITTLQLELAKKEILSAYGDEIISAMVSGNSIDELTESAEKAHMEYISIRDKEIAKVKEASKPKQVGTGISPQNTNLKSGVSVADIMKISDPETWGKNRDKFLEEAIKQLG